MSAATQRAKLAAGVDPGEARKAQRSAVAHEAIYTFGAVAWEWVGKRKAGWAPGHALHRLSNTTTRNAGAPDGRVRTVAPRIAPKLRMLVVGLEVRNVRLPIC